MKKDLHPAYNPIDIRCACGTIISTKSTKSEIKLEVCSECHTFFTGTAKQTDRGGRAEKFKEKFGL